MPKSKVIPSLLILLCLLGCGKAADQKKEENSKFEITMMTPAIEKAQAQFRKQDRRLEFNGCVLRYNGKTFGFDSTIGDLVKVFGQYSTYKYGVYTWHEMGVSVFSTNEEREDPSANLQTFNLRLNTIIPIEMGTSAQRAPEPYDYVLLGGFPVNRNTPFSDLTDYTRLTVEDFKVDNHGYHYRYECGNTELNYYIAADAPWVYQGGGHLMFKSHPKPHNENPILEISIEREEKK